MKAAQYNSYGGPEVIEINSNAPKPILKDGQILVEVYASSLNPFDYKVRQGYMKDVIPLKFPVTIGGDFAGVVKETGVNFFDYSVGDEVFGQSIATSGASGSTAEFATAFTKNVTKKPKNIDFKQAAALVLVGVSAIQAFEEYIKLSSGQKILIHGGAGGIGSIAIQLAKHLGAYVATTVGTNDIEFARNLGADVVIDYKTQKFEEIIKDYDAVFDTVGGETLERSVAVLKKNGVLVSMAGKPDEKNILEHDITAIAQNSGTTTTRLERLRDLVETGIINPQIDKVFTFDEASKAYDYLENSHPKGKVVIDVKS